MKAKDKAEKKLIKIRFAAGLNIALNDSKFKSFRELAFHIGFEPSHIQRISAGKVDVELSTIIAMAEGFGITFQKLSTYYDELSQDDIKKFLEDQAGRKKNKIAKKPVRKKNKKKS